MTDYEWMPTDWFQL